MGSQCRCVVVAPCHRAKLETVATLGDHPHRRHQIAQRAERRTGRSDFSRRAQCRTVRSHRERSGDGQHPRRGHARPREAVSLQGREDRVQGGAGSRRDGGPFDVHGHLGHPGHGVHQHDPTQVLPHLDREGRPPVHRTARPEPVAVLDRPVREGDDVVRVSRRACPDTVDDDLLRPVLIFLAEQRDPGRKVRRHRPGGSRVGGNGTGRNGAGNAREGHGSKSARDECTSVVGEHEAPESRGVTVRQRRAS